MKITDSKTSKIGFVYSLTVWLTSKTFSIKTIVEINVLDIKCLRILITENVDDLGKI